MSLSHADQIEPKTIENGVVIPAGLQIGEMTLKEHQDYLVWQKSQRKLTRREAIQAGHRPSEIYDYFGPLHQELEAKPILDLKLVEKQEEPQPMLMMVTSELPKALGLDVAAAVRSEPIDQYAQSKAQGYTGDSCPGCGMFTMVNNGTCLVCVGCGHTTGCS